MWIYFLPQEFFSYLCPKLQQMKFEAVNPVFHSWHHFCQSYDTHKLSLCFRVWNLFNTYLFWYFLIRNLEFLGLISTLFRSQWNFLGCGFPSASHWSLTFVPESRVTLVSFLINRRKLSGWVGGIGVLEVVVRAFSEEFLLKSCSSVSPKPKWWVL